MERITLSLFLKSFFVGVPVSFENIYDFVVKWFLYLYPSKFLKQLWSL